MIINYGYEDGSGAYFITIDTERCNGCKKCIASCPNGIFLMMLDEFDPLEDRMIVSVVEKQRNRLKYICSACKPVNAKNELPCVQACTVGALKHF